MNYLQLAFCLLICLPFCSQAQILNVEKNRIDRDSANYFVGSFGLNMNIKNRSAAEDDPIKFFSLGGNADLAYFSEKHSYMWLNFLSYLEINESAFISTGFSHGRITLMRKKKVAYELFGQYQYDLLRGLNNRWLGGGGLRFNLLQKENIDVALGLGLMYEAENWEHPEENEANIQLNLAKSSNYFHLHTKLNERVDYNIITYYQLGYDTDIEAIRHRFNVDTNLIFNIAKGFSFRTSFSGSYENRPVVPITKFIYSISNGVQFSF